MAIMSNYCKAYLLKDFRQFNHWVENPDNLKFEKERALADDIILYLHENYIVTDGIFQDEYIIFDQVTPEWKAFCQEALNFEIPNYV